MKSFKSSISLSFIPRSIISVFLLVILSCIYMKMGSPPDVDKSPFPPAASDNSGWLATAANMLAGAGYGNGSTVQARADTIYMELVSHFGTVGNGWANEALNWWLYSPFNTWPANPYKQVNVYGNIWTKHPWQEPMGARFIGNELRRCQFVGLGISWPTDALDAAGNAIIGSGRHSVTAWGDHFKPTLCCESKLVNNPNKVRVTDSDRETGGDVQSYIYDSYNNPNPGGSNEGNGWYFNYDSNHPYIVNVVTLCPIDYTPSDTACTQTKVVVGSYKIHQTSQDSATDLHYEVSTEGTVLGFHTTVDWSTENEPTIIENQPQRNKIKVDWDFTDNPVPNCKWVTITTEFTLICWSEIEYDSVYFTYTTPDIPDIVVVDNGVPSVGLVVVTPDQVTADSITDVTGGYFLGSFDIVNLELSPDQRTVGEYRLIHEYSYNQSPEEHTFILTGDQGYHATNFRFGHSYGYLSPDSLWEFKDWLTEITEKPYLMADTIKFDLNWEGLLPSPKPEGFRGRKPELKKK